MEAQATSYRAWVKKTLHQALASLEDEISREAVEEAIRAREGVARVATILGGDLARAATPRPRSKVLDVESQREATLAQLLVHAFCCAKCGNGRLTNDGTPCPNCGDITEPLPATHYRESEMFRKWGLTDGTGAEPPTPGEGPEAKLLEDGTLDLSGVEDTGAPPPQRKSWLEKRTRRER